MKTNRHGILVISAMAAVLFLLPQIALGLTDPAAFGPPMPDGNVPGLYLGGNISGLGYYLLYHVNVSIQGDQADVWIGPGPDYASLPWHYQEPAIDLESFHTTIPLQVSDITRTGPLPEAQFGEIWSIDPFSFGWDILMHPATAFGEDFSIVNPGIVGMTAADQLFTDFFVRVNVINNDGFSIVSTPEPTTMVLLGSGLLGLWGARKKFKK